MERCQALPYKGSFSMGLLWSKYGPHQQWDKARDIAELPVAENVQPFGSVGRPIGRMIFRGPGIYKFVDWHIPFQREYNIPH